MDRVKEEDNSLQTELVSPPSLKRLRTYCTVTDNHSGESRFDFSELLTFWHLSLKSTTQNSVFLLRTAGNTNIQEKQEETQDNNLIVTPKTPISYSNSENTGPSQISFIAAERDLVHLDKDEQPLVNQSDTLCSYPLDDAGVALAESHTLKDTDRSSHSDIQLLKSNECTANSCWCFPAGKDNNWEDLKDECNSPKSSSDYADFISYYSYAYPCRNFGVDVTNEEKILQLQICENENVAICGGETKGQVNMNSMSDYSILPVTERVEGSVVAYNGVLVKSSATESECVETDDLCGVKREHAAGKMIANARIETAAHPTETQISARISQEPAEGGNNAGIFSVIEPAIWNETDSEAKEEHCNSKSTPGVELSPSIKACEMEAPLSPCVVVRPSDETSAPNQTTQFNHQSTTQQYKSEKEDLRQPCTEPQAFSISTSETHNMTGNQGNMPCGSAKTLPAGHVGQEIHKTVGHQSKKRDQSHCFPVSLHNLTRQGIEQTQAEIARMDGTTEKEREEIKSFEIQIGEHRKIEEAWESTKENLQQDETREISTCDCISNWSEGGGSEFDSRLTVVEDEHEKSFDCFSDHSYSANMCRVLDVTVDKENKNVTNVGEEIKPDGHESSEIVVKSQDLQQQIEYEKDITGASHVERVGDCTEGHMSTSANKLILLIQHEEGSNGNVCPGDEDQAKTCMVENTPNLVDFTSAVTSDAVVPCLNDLSHSQNANSKPTSSNCSGRCPPVPSAFSLYDRMPGGFDSFEKIHLSPDDDDNYYAGLSNNPLLTSLFRQLLNTPQRHSVPGAETKGHDQLLEEAEEEEEDSGEKEVGRSECHMAYMANGALNCDTKCKELPNFTSAADVIAINQPEQPSNCESSCESIQGDVNTQTRSSTGSTESYSPASDISSYPEFEMKKHFDMVLKELSLFFNISVSDLGSSRASSAEQCHDTTQPLEAELRKEQISTKALGCHRNTSDEDHSLEACGGDPVVSCIAGSCDGEREVPLVSHSCPETSMYTAEKHRGSEPGERKQRRKTWSPSFMPPPLLEQLTSGPEQLKRLKPLRTCTRPIRVGLSKRAKTNHLHRPHPYK